MRPVAIALAGLALGAACTGGSPVEDSVRDVFVDCMEEQGIEVQDVEVSVRRGNHIDTFEWEVEQDNVGETGDRCEDAALQQFEVSRT